MADTTPNLPHLNWGIITTGMISSWFVSDLLIPRPHAPATHTITAIGSSSLSKGQAFCSKHVPSSAHQPTLYASYSEVYTDPNVDIVYIGSPHHLHKQQCLDAVAAGKHVLCEKPFCINAKEAREVVDAAKRKGVYVAEAMWLRHRPLVKKLREVLWEEDGIGEVYRMTSHFGLDMDIKGLPEGNRYKHVEMGAGSLLDIGIYPLTWAVILLEKKTSEEEVDVNATRQSFVEGVEAQTSSILWYPKSKRHGMISSTTNGNASAGKAVAIVEGSKGYIEVSGNAPSWPIKFTVFPKETRQADDGERSEQDGKEYRFEELGKGFMYEADDAAIDISKGRLESSVIPLSETLRVMAIMDEMRSIGGTKYPQDD